MIYIMDPAQHKTMEDLYTSKLNTNTSKRDSSCWRLGYCHSVLEKYLPTPPIKFRRYITHKDAARHVFQLNISKLWRRLVLWLSNITFIEDSRVYTHERNTNTHAFHIKIRWIPSSNVNKTTMYVYECNYHNRSWSYYATNTSTLWPQKDKCCQAVALETFCNKKSTSFTLLPLPLLRQQKIDG